MKVLIASTVLAIFAYLLAHAQQDTARKYAVVMFTKVYVNDPAYLSLYAFYEDGTMEKLHEVVKLDYPFSGGTTKQGKAYLPTYPKNMMLILAHMRKRGYELFSKMEDLTFFNKLKRNSYARKAFVYIVSTIVFACTGYHKLELGTNRQLAKTLQ